MVNPKNNLYPYVRFNPRTLWWSKQTYLKGGKEGAKNR